MHFGADVPVWDVVNEAIDPSQSDGFRRSPWFNIIGPEFIDIAFQTAREAAPAAKLYYNDFSTTDTTKLAFIAALVSGMKSRGVPIDGVGHQMHNNVDFPSGQAVVNAINTIHALGVDNSVTELDISIYSGSFSTPGRRLHQHSGRAVRAPGLSQPDFFQAFKQLQGKIKSVTFWGKADNQTWLTSSGRVDGPLLFDISLLHKLAYTALVDPSQLPGAGSTAVFSGAYRVAPPGAGSRPTAAASFSLSNNGPSGTLSFNFNNPSTRVRFESASIITYYRSSSGAGNAVDFTVVGTSTTSPATS